MLLNTHTCENGWSNFSDNPWVVAIKFAWVHSVRITYQFPKILYGVGVRCYVDIFTLTARAQSIYSIEKSMVELILLISIKFYNEFYCSALTLPYCLVHGFVVMFCIWQLFIIGKVSCIVKHQNIVFVLIIIHYVLQIRVHLLISVSFKKALP